MKPSHKFFDVTLDNDLESLKQYLSEIEEKIFTENILSVPSDILKKYDRNQPGTLTQLGINYYNVFTFVNPEIFKLKEALRKITIEACEYYGIDFEKEDFWVQGWFNINYNHVGKLDWHEHGGSGAPWFHGYYCVKAEPSITHYKVFDKDFENINKNNRAILSETGHPHAMADWNWEGPRITVAYDVIPHKGIMREWEQHWIPLA